MSQSMLSFQCQDKDIEATLVAYSKKLDTTWPQHAACILKQQDRKLWLEDADGQMLHMIPLPLRLCTLPDILRAVLSPLTKPEASLPLGKGFELHISKRAIVDSENKAMIVELTEKECLLMETLCQYRETGISKEVLLQEIWGYHPEVESHTLDTHLYRLRQKLASITGLAAQVEVEEGRCRLSIAL